MHGLVRDVYVRRTQLVSAKVPETLVRLFAVRRLEVALAASCLEYG